MRIGIEIWILLIIFLVFDITILICSFRVNKKDKANKEALEMAIKALDGHTEGDGTACVEWREINDAPTIIAADGGRKCD